MKRHVRIEADGPTGHTTRVIYLDGETETDISSVITGVDLRIRVDEPIRATLNVISTGGRVNAELEALVIEEILPHTKPPRTPDTGKPDSKLRFWRWSL